MRRDMTEMDVFSMCCALKKYADRKSEPDYAIPTWDTLTMQKMSWYNTKVNARGQQLLNMTKSNVNAGLYSDVELRNWMIVQQAMGIDLGWWNIEATEASVKFISTSLSKHALAMDKAIVRNSLSRMRTSDVGKLYECNMGVNSIMYNLVRQKVVSHRTYVSGMLYLRSVENPVVLVTRASISEARYRRFIQYVEIG